jgi:septum formation protein
VTLLAQIGIVPHHIIPPDLDETPLRDELPAQYARRLAHAKAAAIEMSGAYVLAADTVVAVGRRILPKAETEAEARDCLRLLSGRRHRVMTGVALRAPDGRFGERVVQSVVAFARLSETQVSDYLAQGEWRGKAGAYAVQGRAAMFIRFLSGSFSNVVGLPLFETAQLLRGLGWPLP